MTKTLWWLVDMFSRLLEPNERDVVLGDLTESQASGREALPDVLGLVLRRQAALWKDWRPWLALIALAVPVGLLLTHMSVGLNLPLDMHLRTYLRHGVFHETGLTAPEQVALFVCQGLALLTWSWSSGFVLGSLSRRSILITGAVACLISMSPLIFMTYSRVGLAYARGLAELPLLLMTLTLHAVLHTTLFLLPALFGVRYGLRELALGLAPATIMAGAVVVLTVLATWTGGWSQAALVRWSGGTWDASAGWQSRLFRFAVVSWPASYLFVVAISRRLNLASRRMCT